MFFVHCRGIPVISIPRKSSHVLHSSSVAMANFCSWRFIECLKAWEESEIVSCRVIPFSRMNGYGDWRYIGVYVNMYIQQIFDALYNIFIKKSQFYPDGPISTIMAVVSLTRAPLRNHFVRSYNNCTCCLKVFFKDILHLSLYIWTTVLSRCIKGIFIDTFFHLFFIQFEKPGNQRR